MKSKGTHITHVKKHEYKIHLLHEGLLISITEPQYTHWVHTENNGNALISEGKKGFKVLNPTGILLKYFHLVPAENQGRK